MSGLTRYDRSVSLLILNREKGGSNPPQGSESEKQKRKNGAERKHKNRAEWTRRKSLIPLFNFCRRRRLLQTTATSADDLIWFYSKHRSHVCQVNQSTVSLYNALLLKEIRAHGAEKKKIKIKNKKKDTQISKNRMDQKNRNTKYCHSLNPQQA